MENTCGPVPTHYHEGVRKEKMRKKAAGKESDVRACMGEKKKPEISSSAKRACSVWAAHVRGLPTPDPNHQAELSEQESAPGEQRERNGKSFSAQNRKNRGGRQK